VSCRVNEDGLSWSFNFDRRVDPVVAAPDQELRGLATLPCYMGALRSSTPFVLPTCFRSPIPYRTAFYRRHRREVFYLCSLLKSQSITANGSEASVASAV